MPGVRDVRRERPNQHGGINESRYMTDREIVLEGVITGATSTAVYTEYDALQSVLYDALGTERTLKWTREGSGLTLQAAVKCGDVFDAPLASDYAGVRLPFQITLIAQDPRAYSQTQDTDTGAALSDASGGMVFPLTFNFTFTASGAGEVEVTSAGTIETPAEFRIYGHCVTPQILNVDTGDRMVFTGEVADGGYMAVDTFDRTVTVGSVNRLNLYDYENSDGWLQVPAGTTTFRLLSPDFNANAKLVVVSRAAYL